VHALPCREFSGKPDAGNPPVRFDEGGGGSSAAPPLLDRLCVSLPVLDCGPRIFGDRPAVGGRLDSSASIVERLA
jgi:hypothetical protein